MPLPRMTPGPKFAACCLTFFSLVIVAAAVWAAMTFVTHKLGVPSGYWLAPVFGALGGIVGGIIRLENAVELCSFENASKVKLGIVGDMVTGLGGASALVFLFGGSLLKFDPNNAESLVMIVSTSFVGGAYGRRIVEMAGERLLRKAREQAQAIAEKEAKKEVGRPAAVSYTYAAKDLITEGEYQEAVEVLKVALQQDPKYPNGHLEMGRALKRLGRVEEALAAVEKAISLKPNYGPGLYNRACYNSLLGRPAAVIAPDLKEAITLVAKLKGLALTDPDLENARKYPEINNILA